MDGIFFDNILARDVLGRFVDVVKGFSNLENNRQKVELSSRTKRSSQTVFVMAFCYYTEPEWRRFAFMLRLGNFESADEFNA